MKKHLLIVLLIFIGSSNFAQNEKKWFGLKPPGDSPELLPIKLANGNDNKHSRLAFSPDGKQIFYSVYVDKKTPQKIFYVEFLGGKWSEPRLAHFSGKFKDGGPIFSPDGKKLYFYSKRPLPGKSENNKNYDIWFVDKTPNGWSEPIYCGENINSNDNEMIVYISKDGTMYLRTYDENIIHRLFRLKMKNGEYQSRELIKIITDEIDFKKPVEFENEEFFIQEKDVKKGKYYYSFLAISYKKENGKWTEFFDLDEDINKGEGRFHSYSPDGKYFFFVSYRTGKAEYYWMKSDFLKKQKEKYVNR